MSQLLVIGNPRKRKSHRRRAKSKRRHVARRRRRSTSRRRSRTYVRARRNPVSALTSGVVPTIKDGALGAVGGLANDLLYGVAASKLSFLPAAGLGRHAAKIATAIVIGKVGNMVMRGKGGALARGAATVAIHAALKEQVQTLPFLAQFNLGEYIEEPAQLHGGYDAGMPVDGFVDAADEMGEYLEQ